MKKVIVVGGGISGLTVADILSSKGYKVDLYEQDSLLGGMAKTRREINGVPTEHSWRGFAPFYKNFFQTLSTIPISSSKSKSVLDNITTPETAINFYLLKDYETTNYQPRINFLDSVVLYYYGLKYLFSDERKQDYYKTKVVPLLKTFLSKDGYDYLVEFLIGPGLGMEQRDVSFSHFFKIPVMYKSSGKWFVTTKPTNEAIFDQWEKKLKNANVQINYNSKLEKINTLENNTIESLIINGVQKKADYYVLCINPFVCVNIFKQSKMNELYLQHLNLTKDTESKQISFRLGFKKEIKYGINNIAFAMVDTEFNITWYPQEKHWDKSVDLGLNLKSLWSGTCIKMYEKGSLYKNKTALEMTKDELMEEIVHQIFRSKSLVKLIKDNNDFELTTNDIVFKELWYEWTVDNGELRQEPKKWVNNVTNQEFRPSQKTKYANLFLGGSHTKTTIDIWSMEGANESGKNVVNAILENDGGEKIEVYKHTFDNKVINLIRVVDNVLYKLNLPSIVDIIIIILIVYIIKKKVKLS